MNPHRWRGLSEIARYPVKEVDVDDAACVRCRRLEEIARPGAPLAYLEKAIAPNHFPCERYLNKNFGKKQALCHSLNSRFFRGRSH
jgi:hypothetical protein